MVQRRSRRQGPGYGATEGEEEAPEDQIVEPHSANTLCAGPVITSRESSVIGHSFSVGVVPLSQEPVFIEGEPRLPENGLHIILVDDRGFGKSVCVESKEYPKYPKCCVLTPSGKVIVIDELPEEGSPGEQYFKPSEGAPPFHYREVSIEVPTTPKKRVLET